MKNKKLILALGLALSLTNSPARADFSFFKESAKNVLNCCYITSLWGAVGFLGTFSLIGLAIDDDTPEDSDAQLKASVFIATACMIGVAGLIIAGGGKVSLRTT